jgi:uncharacterized protein (DUF433 family)
MANLDWSQCPVVESIPGKVSGAWVFRGTRDQIQTALDFVAKSTQTPPETLRAG